MSLPFYEPPNHGKPYTPGPNDPGRSHTGLPPVTPPNRGTYHFNLDEGDDRPMTTTSAEFTKRIREELAEKRKK